jgi:hypothetical protein
MGGSGSGRDPDPTVSLAFTVLPRKDSVNYTQIAAFLKPS